MTRLAVVDYGIGNLASAHKALVHVGADAVLTADPDEIRAAAGVVLPGVGAFGRCMEALRSAGLDDVALDVIDAGRPFLGICVGMQMLFEGSDESPGVDGLGVLPGRSRLLPLTVKRPQMQWNVLERRGEPALLGGVADPAWAYFVHSFSVHTDPGLVSATCDYGGPVVAAVARGTLWATQFHPEKSSVTGLAVLSNFVAEASRASGAAEATRGRG